MIPYILAAVGGYLLGDSMEESQKKTGFEPYSKKMADGGEVDSSTFDQLKKGDKVKITFGSTISSDGNAELLVKSKNLVGKGKSYECEKITFVNTKNPDGVKFYAYKRKSGDVGFAIGDLAIHSVKIKEKMADGGVLENAADLEIDMDSMNSNTLILELEIGNYDNTESKYFFEYSVDHNERSYSLNAIYDENDNKVSKELHDELEMDKSLDNQLHYAIMDAFQDYADEKYESRNDYNEEED